MSSTSRLISSKRSDPEEYCIMIIGLVDPEVDGTTVL
jgi:hypothetical protein